MGLRNGILIRIRKKHIRIGNKFDCVEGVTSVSQDASKENESSLSIETLNMIIKRASNNTITATNFLVLMKYAADEENKNENLKWYLLKISILCLHSFGLCSILQYLNLKKRKLVLKASFFDFFGRIAKFIRL